MNNMVHIICEQRNDVQTSRASQHYSEDIDKLAYVIIASARSVYTRMGPGLPRCVYQLNLCNDLLKKGLRMQTQMSMLNHCVKHEPDRELIIVNETILIECIVEGKINFHLKKRVTFDLENTSHAKGLLINFSDATQNDMIAIIDHTSVLH